MQTDHEEAVEVITAKIKEYEEKIIELRNSLKTLKEANRTNRLASSRAFGTLTVSRAAIEVLEKSPDPMEISEIVDTINQGGRIEATPNSVSVAFKRYRRKGRVKEVPGSRPTKWYVNKEWKSQPQKEVPGILSLVDEDLGLISDSMLE